MAIALLKTDEACTGKTVTNLSLDQYGLNYIRFSDGTVRAWRIDGDENGINREPVTAEGHLTDHELMELEEIDVAELTRRQDAAKVARERETYERVKREYERLRGRFEP